MHNFSPSDLKTILHSKRANQLPHHFIARPGQSLKDHLLGVGAKASIFSKKIGLPQQGNLLGLLHDFGKYSQQFQDYIKSAAGEFNPDIDDEYVDYKKQKGKIDHSTAGAQWIWQKLKGYGDKGQGELCGQILAVCIASHHSGLIDCLKPDEIESEKINNFLNRINKEDDKTHLKECEQTAKDEGQIFELIESVDAVALIKEMCKKIGKITATEQHGQSINNSIKAFYLGIFTRFLFSCLIDADRIDSSKPDESYQKRNISWRIAIERLEKKLSEFTSKERIDDIRKDISKNCLQKAKNKQGIYTLTVPTGGGKTLASLRYALHHANQHKLDRVIYIIPYTSIIEQNADEIRQIIEEESDNIPWILEHHSNLEPEKETWHSKITSENWDAPIVLTTMVQFLEVLFSGGTRSVRRLHQLANSVLIFDEIQTIPINCVHLFCNALNFLVEHTKTTALLCTATQPLLDKLEDPAKGQLFIDEDRELVEDTSYLFDELKRVDVHNNCKLGGWSKEEIADLALQEFADKKSCLVVVNTKSWAKNLYELCYQKVPKETLFHLSTSQCAAHRKEELDKIKLRLKEGLPVLCISTQLIQAGVNISFASAIRFLAGLDSIAQVAGRCNRHGELKDKSGKPIQGTLHIVEPDNENLKSLEEIKIGQDVTRRILTDMKDNNEDFSQLFHPDKIKRYFDEYFFKFANKMDYKVKGKNGLSLFELLSDKSNRVYEDSARKGKFPLLQQSFKSAGEYFKAIDAPTHAVIVPYGKGADLIAELGRVDKKFDKKQYYRFLREAQRYAVNVFPNVWGELLKKEAVYEIQPGEGIYRLDERFYSKKFGLDTEEVSSMNFYNA